MGYGDDLMITALASQTKKKFPEKQIIIGNAFKQQAYHSIIYENNPNISDCRKLDLKKPIHLIDYHQGNRPYINYEKSLKLNKYVWNFNFKPNPGELYFSQKEISTADNILEEAKKYWFKKNNKNYKAIIFLETSSTKIDDIQFGIKHKNKDWGENNWSNLIKRLVSKYLIIQCSHEKSKKMENIFSTQNINFRQACAILSKCDLLLGPEGGFGHAAAALKKNAVLYFGGWISPDVIGYDFHQNIYFNSNNSPCGEYKKICKHCIEARKKITVETFEDKIQQIFETN